MKRPPQASVRPEFSLSQIDLNLLRAFDVLMQERSVTRAAARLGRTQPAMSHSLAKLRDIFNDELFTRDSGLMEPTPRARELASVISRSLSDIRSAIDRHLNFEAETTSRNFRLGVSDYTAVAFLPALIEAFAAQAPLASLNVLHVREGDVGSLLRNREIECAILGNAGAVKAPLAIDVLSRDVMVCAGWEGNPLLEDLTAEDYLAFPHLQISADGTAAGVVDAVLDRQDRQRRVVATVPHYLVAPWIIKGTPLVTVFGDSVLLALSPESETRIIQPPIPLPDVTVSLIYEASAEGDPGHRWFRGIIRSISDAQQQRKEAIYRRLRWPSARG
ncbi:LysR family transcriptional regulator [Methylobacterium sp. NEAU 140]|uniref:LysR family transcriptional regulator n=1 Tax=Methylobacterium sp. NEAU 140 TaxID=3064945 RepID=UPI002734A2C5|nr:LysR family transcriptional regulator [Methylobacterium sp. NEAU 140]MDP4021988.1 LysR family transcriptional regulator [Methylobacterium sp. NEAU 140]